MYITPHAVHRYIERIDTRASYEVALDRLIELSSRAHRTGDARDGSQRWRTPGPERLRLVVAPAADGMAPQVVTVMPQHDGARALR